MNQTIADRLARLAESHNDPMIRATAAALLEQYRYADPEAQAQIERRFKSLLNDWQAVGPTEIK